MKLTLTFHGLDGDAEDQVIGTVTWDGTTATADPAGDQFLAAEAAGIQAAPDPAAAMREIAAMYRSAYSRAELTEN